MRVLISGYYGFGNTGDEAVLQSIVQGIRERDPEAKIIVLSSSPKITAEFFKVHSIYRYSLWSTIRQMRKADVFVSGGGTLLQNVTSNRSFFYYAGLILLARLLRKKVMIFAQGFGPLKGIFANALARYVLNRVDLITLRDEESFEKIKKLGVKNPNISVTADPTLILDVPLLKEGEKLLSLEGVRKSGRPLLGIAIRNPNNESDDFTRHLVDAINWLTKEYNYVPVLILFQSPQDMHQTSKIIHGIKESAHLIFRICKPGEMLSLFSQFDLLIGMRLHSLIFALINDLPMLGISYDPKVKAFMKMIGQPQVEINELGKLKELLGKVIYSKENIRESLKEQKVLLRQKAEKNFELLWKL
jgi:polysaccharide pyruvyl transferase CsaB